MIDKKRSLYAYLCHRKKEVLRATSTPSCVEAKWVQSENIVGINQATAGDSTVASQINRLGHGCYVASSALSVITN